MPKIISPEIKYQVISLYTKGYSRDEIAQNLGIGAGTVSKMLDESRKDLGDGEYEAIRNWGRLLKKNDSAPQDVLNAIRTWNLLKKHGIEESELPQFLENLSAVNDAKDATGLLRQASHMMSIQRKVGGSFEEINEKYVRLSQNVPKLRAEQNSLQESIKKLDQDRLRALQVNKTTEKELRHFTVIKSRYSEIGLQLEDLPKLVNALDELKRLDYDVPKLLEYLEQIKHLGNRINQYTKALQKLQGDLHNTKHEQQSISQRLKRIKKQYSYYYDATKVVLEFLKRNEDPNDIIDWKKIIKKNKMSIEKFGSELETYGSFTDYLGKLAQTIKTLEERQKNLQTDVNTLQTSKNNLAKQIQFATKDLDQKIIHTKKEIDGLSSNPFRMILNSEKPYNVLPILLVFFEELRNWYANNKLDEWRVMSHLETIIADIKKMNSK